MLSLLQIFLSLTTTLPALRLVRGLLISDGKPWISRLIRASIAYAVALPVTLIQLGLTASVVGMVVIGGYLILNPEVASTFDPQKFFKSKDPTNQMVGGIMNSLTIFVTVLLDRPFLGSFGDVGGGMPVLRAVLRLRLALTRTLIRIGATMILMGLSLLPLSVLLLALPAVNTSEAVLVDTLPRARSMLRRFVRRVGGIVSAFVMLIVLLSFATEVITRLRLPGDTFYGTMARKMLSAELSSRLPNALVEHWPHVLLLVYLLDLVVLAVIGKVPHSYSLRNMIVRWRITGLTAVAFIVVLFMLTFMLAFVNGLTKITEQSGVPGNVLIMSDGATDEIFSNLQYGDVGELDTMEVTHDERGRRLPKPITVKKLEQNGKMVFLGSRETYCVVNQQIPESTRRRFVQLRIVVDPAVSAAVHNVSLMSAQDRWFKDVDKSDKNRIECVLGQAIAETLGVDAKKKSLEPGDEFELADLKWVVVGIMKTEGTTFGSEVWCAKVTTVTQALGKNNYTSYVMRVSDESEAGAKSMASYIRNHYEKQKLKAVSEKEYFADLNKNNQQTLYMVMVVAIVMAIGGVFGVMNTMFAAIAQRTKDIGVLRLLGFKRWQVLVAFLLESMAIALIGGAIGVALGSLCDGYAVTSIASSGQGGGKSVAAKLMVDRDVMLIGMLFTLVMGRLGGLVPALSAMRLEILESLR